MLLSCGVLKINKKIYKMGVEFELGFIGGGNMSTAIANGIVRSASHPSNKIWVSGPNLNNLKHWSEMGAHITQENGEVISNCDIVFLGVKPNMLKASISNCLNAISEQKRSVVVVSMLAGISINQLNEVLSALKWDIKVIRIMPNTPMMVGQGACLITPDSNVPEESICTIETLLKSCAVCERVSESMMDSLGVLTGCGPAFIYIIIEALADGAVKQGVPRASALKLAAQMVAGSGQMVLQTGKHPGVLKDEVCSPGGSTICGVTALEDGKIRSLMIHAIEAAAYRTKQLGQKK